MKLVARPDHRLSRRQLSALALVLVACGQSAEPVAQNPPAKNPDPEADPPEQEPPAPPATTGKPPEKPPLGPPPTFDATDHAHIARTVFWSWTTPEQIAEIRAGGPLFSREARDDLGPGHLYTVLASLAEQWRAPGAGNDPRLPIVEALLDPAYHRGRYTWINPWATCAGYHGESYGDQLLRLELRPDAWLARIFSLDGAVDIVDLANQPVSLERFLAEPKRLAGVYFVSGLTGGKGSFGALAGPYREVYIGNRAMVARASLGTEEIRQGMTQAAASLRALWQMPWEPYLFPIEQNAWLAYVPQVWRDAASEGWAGYHGGLCFPDLAYWPTKDNIEVLAGIMESRLPESPLDPLEILV